VTIAGTGSNTSPIAGELTATIAAVTLSASNAVDPASVDRVTHATAALTVTLRTPGIGISVGGDRAVTLAPPLTTTHRTPAIGVYQE
jgi:hypothetical protein